MAAEDVETLVAARSTSQTLVRAHVGDRLVLHATTAHTDRPVGDEAWWDAMPDVPAPDDCPPFSLTFDDPADESFFRLLERRAPELLLQVALLRRAELVVEDHRVAVERLGQLLELGDLALAEVGGRIGGGPTLQDAADDVRTRRVHQHRELVQIRLGALGIATTERHADDDDPLPERPVDERPGRAAVVAERATVGFLRVPGRVELWVPGFVVRPAAGRLPLQDPHPPR